MKNKQTETTKKNETKNMEEFIPLKEVHRRVRGDGNCFFRAISLGLYGNEE